MTAISFNNINKTFQSGFNTSRVLRDISFQVKKGEIFGFLGPNGAGKSTSIKILLNFIKPSSGNVFIEDIRVGEKNFQHLIGYLPETPCFYENLTAMEILDFSGKASGVKGGELKKSSLSILERLNLGHAVNSQIKTFSKGMKQRLGIATALLHDPEIFILDEPMSGLDPMGRHLISEVILELKKKGKTVFFSSHILSDVDKLCDRIAVLNRGKQLFTGLVNDFCNEGTSFEDAFIKMINEDNRENKFK